MTARKTKRSEELSTRSAIAKKFLEVMVDVEKGVEDQRVRTDDIMDQWDAYNCVLGPRQFYNGNSQIYLPIIADAVNARRTRFVNQIFPQSQRNVEVTTENADMPSATVALLEHYVRVARLRTEIVPALVVNGDVEGQYSVYVGWKKTKRFVVQKKMVAPKVDGLEHKDLGEVEDVVEEEIEEGSPDIEIIADADLVILPIISNSADDAIEQGGSVTILRRWTKAKIRQLIRDEDIVKTAGEDLIKNMKKVAEGTRPDTGKKLADNAGIKRKGDFALVYEVWTKLKIDGEWRLTRGYYAGESLILGVKLCPYWCDRCPVITGPVEKQANVAKGKSPINRVLDIQVFANDTINEGADTAHFSAMPIIMTDPEKNPRVGSMVLGLASVWETSPNDTKFAEFPELWKSAFERVASCKTEIFQSLGVNPAMISQSTGSKGGKRNQAEIAVEQQVDILTTADAVTGIEEIILTPLLQRIVEYDHQFRDDVLTVRMYGEMGHRAVMQDVEPLQMNRRFEFRWFGVEAARNAAQVQQQIAMANVLKDVPPALYQGYRLDLAPLMVQLAENTYGPRLAPLILVSMKDDMGVPPEQENEMMEHGFEVHVHPADNDPEHMQVHMEALQGGDPHGTVRAHFLAHQTQMQTKAQAQMMAQQGGGEGQPPAQGGGGGPKPGATPGQPHAAKQPAGAIHKDRMAAAGAPGMPRKT